MAFRLRDFYGMYQRILGFMKDVEELKKQVNAKSTQLELRLGYLVQIIQVNAGAVTTYDIAFISGSDRMLTSITLQYVRAVSDDASFSVGDKAFLISQPPEPPLLVSGGGTGGTESTLPAHSHNSDVSGYAGFLSGNGY